LLPDPVWRIDIDPRVEKDLRKVDRATGVRILDFLHSRIASLRDPRSVGKALTGRYAGLWRYRIGDYRVICKIEDDRLVVLVLEVGHRREIYR
jgi:mRNA interferase RelE/StbE